MKNVFTAVICLSMTLIYGLMFSQSLTFENTFRSDKTASVFLKDVPFQQAGKILMIKNQMNTNSAETDYTMEVSGIIQYLDPDNLKEEDPILIPGNIMITSLLPYLETEFMVTGYKKRETDPENCRYPGRENQTYQILRLDESGKIKWSLSITGDIKTGNNFTCQVNEKQFVTTIPFRGPIKFRNQIIHSSNHSVDILMLLMDYKGEVIDYHCFNGNGDEYINAVKSSPNGIYLAMHFNHELRFDLLSLNSKGRNDGVYLHLNPRFEIEHFKQLGSEYDDKVTNLEVDKEQNIYLCGTYSAEISDADFRLKEPAGSLDCFVGKIKNDDEVMWVEGFGNRSNDYIQSMIIARDNSVIVCGHFRNDISESELCPQSKGWLNEIFILNISSDGELMNSGIIINQGEGFNGKLISDTKGNLWVGGNISQLLASKVQGQKHDYCSGYFIKKATMLLDTGNCFQDTSVNSFKSVNHDLSVIKSISSSDLRDTLSNFAESIYGDSQGNIHMQLYPNPVNDYCTIMLHSGRPLGKVELVVINELGKYIWRAQVNNASMHYSQMIPPALLSRGKYTVILVKNNLITDSRHMIKL